MLKQWAKSVILPDRRKFVFLWVKPTKCYFTLVSGLIG